MSRVDYLFENATLCDLADLADINLLNQQLSNNSETLAWETYAAILQKPDTHILAVRDSSQEKNGRAPIVAKATLYVTFLDNGVTKGIIENVVTHTNHRGNGLAKRMCQKLIEVAQQRGASHIDLTSNPTRTAAHTLYEKLGFQQRETQVYRLDLKK